MPCRVNALSVPVIFSFGVCRVWPGILCRVGPSRAGSGWAAPMPSRTHALLATANHWMLMECVLAVFFYLLLWWCRYDACTVTRYIHIFHAHNWILACASLYTRLSIEEHLVQQNKWICLWLIRALMIYYDGGYRPLSVVVWIHISNTVIQLSHLIILDVRLQKLLKQRT